jgi:hypothetical protein
VLDPLNAWLGKLFDHQNVERTVAALVASQSGSRAAPSTQEVLTKRLAEAQARLRRFHAAIEAGVDPAALVEAINEAQAQRAAVQAELEGAPTSNALTAAEVHAMIDYLGDVGRALNQADPARLQDLYEALRLEMIYDAEARTVDVTIRPAGRGSAGVRGGTPTRRGGIPAQSRYACKRLYQDLVRLWARLSGPGFWRCVSLGKDCGFHNRVPRIAIISQCRRYIAISPRCSSKHIDSG